MHRDCRRTPVRLDEVSSQDWSGHRLNAVWNLGDPFTAWRPEGPTKSDPN